MSYSARMLVAISLAVFGIGCSTKLKIAGATLSEKSIPSPSCQDLTLTENQFDKSAYLDLGKTSKCVDFIGSGCNEDSVVCRYAESSGQWTEWKNCRLTKLRFEQAKGFVQYQVGQKNLNSTLGTTTTCSVSQGSLKTPPSTNLKATIVDSVAGPAGSALVKPGLQIGCPISPRVDCQAPSKSELDISSATGSSPQLTWSWDSKTPMTKADFGNPTLKTDPFRFCFYNSKPGQVLPIDIPSQSTCAGFPCWVEDPMGFEYQNKDLTLNPTSKVKFKTRSIGKIGVALEGPKLLLSGQMPFYGGITIQLISPTNKCFTSYFSRSEFAAHQTQDRLHAETKMAVSLKTEAGLVLKRLRKIIIKHKATHVAASHTSASPKATPVPNRYGFPKYIPQVEVVEVKEGADYETELIKLKESAEIEYAESDSGMFFTGTAPKGFNQYDNWGLKDMGMTDVWKQELEGSNPIVVAVIDSGIDFTHPDLAESMWQNPAENQTDGIDNDDNGYVDDYYGYDFFSKNARPMDDSGHGTHLAGIIGARAETNSGMVGVSSKVKLMALKVGSFDVSTGQSIVSTAAVIEAINYAIAKDVDVINCSFGDTTLSPFTDEQGLGLREVIQKAYDRNITVVASAGNGAKIFLTDDTPLTPQYAQEHFYPASFPNTISVAAYDRELKLYEGSNFGASITISAPGGNIRSTSVSHGYASLSGTSMAAAYVTGLVALLKSIDPFMLPGEIKERIRQNTIKISNSNQDLSSLKKIGAAAEILKSSTDFSQMGLGSNLVNKVFVMDSSILAATQNGLSISKDRGRSFGNATMAQGLGSNNVLSVFATGDSIFAATSKGLAISRNGGTSFRNALIGSRINGVFANGDSIFAATERGLAISTDGGWRFKFRTTENGLGAEVVNDIKVSGLNVYAATDNGLSISNDGGQTFTNRFFGLGSKSVIGLAVSGNSIFAATQGGLSISNDGGNSFVNKGLQQGLGGIVVFDVAVSGLNVYAATSHGLSISADGGQTFTNRNMYFGLGSNFVPGVAVSGNSIFAATQGGLSISTDGGQIFTNRTEKSGMGSNFVREVFAVGNSVFAATQKGLSISLDGGSRFVNRSTQQGLGSIFVNKITATGNSVFAATQNGLSISLDGGVTFVNRTTKHGLGSSAIKGVAVLGSFVYAATTRGLSISSDGGATFVNKTTEHGLGSNFINGVVVLDSFVYAATQNGLSISSDGGETFVNRITRQGLGSDVITGVAVSGLNVYAVTTQGLSISSDGGETFVNRITRQSLGSNVITGVTVSGLYVYAATAHGISISSNGGVTFSNRTTAQGLGSDFINGVVVSGSSVYAATSEGLSISVDGGATWHNRTTDNTSHH